MPSDREKLARDLTADELAKLIRDAVFEALTYKEPAFYKFIMPVPDAWRDKSDEPEAEPEDRP